MKKQPGNTAIALQSFVQQTSQVPPTEKEARLFMLSIMVLIFPAILAISIHLLLHRKITPPLSKLAAYALFCTISTNLVILTGLKLIGMRDFNLFQMSVSFKLKWLTLEFILTIILSYVLRNIARLDRALCKDILRKAFPPALFCSVTYAVYTPSSLFLSNIEEFSLHYIHIVPCILCMTFLLMAGICLLALCVTNRKAIGFYTSLVFAAALGIYVQSNFLNPKLPSLDGTEINWTLYQTENRISFCFWLLCIILIPLFSLLWKDKTEKPIKYAAYFLSAMQLLSLPVLLFTNRLDESAHYDFTKTGEFSIGRENNILLFVVDTVQSNVMEEYLTSDAYDDAWLDDFTFFDNAVSGGAPTSVAFPLLLTGIEYDPSQSMEEYTSEIWEETSLYDDLNERNYDVRFYTGGHSITNYPDGMIANRTYNGGVGIGNYPEFGSKLYQLVNFYVMPQFLKDRFWMSTDDFRGSIAYSNNGYKLNDIQFYHDLQSASEISCDYENALRLYHLCGVHRPYTMDENMETVEKDSVTEQQVLTGDMKIIREYLTYLKEADLYDASTIMIMGDHGRHEANNIEDNPAVLIKLPQESHPLAHNSAPIHFRNIVATIAKTIMDDYSAYGPNVYDINENSDVERLHTVDATIRSRIAVEEGYDESLDYTRFFILGDARDRAYRVWNPLNINRIQYAIGKPIDFTKDNEYAKEINYRLYKENNAATASNELSICFELDNYKKDDLTLHFSYSGVYNETQKILLYAGGSKVGSIICTQENAGEDHTVAIPKDTVKDGLLTLRMVFPGAVTPNQLDRNNPDTRVLSVAFDSICLTASEKIKK